MSRLDKERQITLEPMRMNKAILEISNLGFKTKQISETELIIVTDINEDYNIKYFPYSGWATGKAIKDGRGLKRLLRQLKSM